MTEQVPDRAPLGAERANLTRRRAQYRRLFEECWTPVRAVVESQLHGALLETLAPLAKSSDEDDAKRAKAVLVRDRAFVQAYLESLQPELSSSIRSFIEAREAEGGGARALSLVGHADSEFDAAIDQCAARLRNSVDAEFGAVKLRLMNLLQDFDLRDTELPFRLALFVRAVAGALRHIGTAEANLIPLMRVVSSGIGPLVAQSYQQIEQRLAASGASDTVQLWHTTIAAPGAAARGRASARAGAAGAEQGRDQAGNETVRHSDAQTQSALMTLLERMQPTAASAVATAAPAAGAVPSGTAAGVAPAASGAAPATQAERIAFLESKAPGAGWTFDPALLTAINDALRASTAAVMAGQSTAGAEAASTGELRRGLIETASRKLDKLTIELVGMLFDRIQRDRHVPDPIKEQLVRLQFPLLKVALSDPELFADPRQPARRLLDRIASTSIGWSGEGEDNRRYFEQVRAAIDAVIDSPGEASKAFAQSLEAFERFLDEERTRDDDPVARARRALAEAENREILAIKCTMQVRSAFDAVQLESYLRDFLLDVWVRVLVDASAHENTEPGLVRKYLDAIPELVWSVQPKINPGDRKRMIGTIPGVLAVLREGLNRIEWPADRIQQFFGRLMNSHASAVKALELAHGSLPQFTASTVRIKLDGFRIPTDTSDVAADQVKVSDDVVRHALSASAAAVTHLSPPPEQSRSSGVMDRQQAIKAIAGWSRGLWFDLRTEGRTERVVLRWVSPKRALYLFTTAAGDCAHSLSPDTLVAYLQSGWLVAVESAPLFDRVVDGVMYDLKHATESTADATD
jgi:uncharacterized protein DUF1631